MLGIWILEISIYYHYFLIIAQTFWYLIFIYCYLVLINHLLVADIWCPLQISLCSDRYLLCLVSLCQFCILFETFNENIRKSSVIVEYYQKGNNIEARNFERNRIQNVVCVSIFTFEITHVRCTVFPFILQKYLSKSEEFHFKALYANISFSKGTWYYFKV